MKRDRWFGAFRGCCDSTTWLTMFTSELVSASDLPKIAALDYQILPNFQHIPDFQPKQISQELGFAWSEKKKTNPLPSRKRFFGAGSICSRAAWPDPSGEIRPRRTCCPKMVPFSVIIHICTPEDERRVHLRVRAHTPGSSESII